LPLQAFTRNFTDNSTEAGFQFTFHCDICNDGYKTQFIQAKTNKKTGLFGSLGRTVSLGARVLGQGETSANVGEATGIITDRFKGMPPAWQKEHDAAFEIAQNEALTHFKRCPKCRKYSCENDWNDQDELCVDCAPKESVEVAAARAKKMSADIATKAANTQVFDGEISRRQTICPKCGQIAGQGKFCNNCGAPLMLLECPKCGAKSSADTRFCGECGTKLT
jgi:hypothetical protein